LRAELRENHLPKLVENRVPNFVRFCTFLEGWKLGPKNNDNWLSIENQKDLLSIRVFLLAQSDWNNRVEERGDYQEQEQEYLKFLEKSGWYGRLILALRPYSDIEFGEPWRRYVEVLREGKPAYIDDFYWRKGLPYKRRERTIEPESVPCSSMSLQQNCPFRRLGSDLSASICLTVLEETTGKTKKTAERVRVKGSFNPLGYLLWVWA
jgi:hypothetical protein